MKNLIIAFLVAVALFTTLAHAVSTQPSFGAIPVSREMMRAQLFQARLALSALEIGEFDPKFKIKTKAAIEKAIHEAEIAISRLPDSPSDILRDEAAINARNANDAVHAVLREHFQGKESDEFTRSALLIMAGTQMIYKSPADLGAVFVKVGADEKALARLDACVAEAFAHIHDLDRTFNGGKPIGRSTSAADYVKAQSLQMQYMHDVMHASTDAFLKSRSSLSPNQQMQADEIVLKEHPVK